MRKERTKKKIDPPKNERNYIIRSFEPVQALKIIIIIIKCVHGFTIYFYFCVRYPDFRQD